MTIRTKRIYDPPDPSDGYRVLVDRIWPRGLAKDKAHIDAWLKDIAPSTELRKWFNHDVDRWPEFKKRYAEELAAHHDTLRQLLHDAGRGPLTLLFAAHDTEHNNAVVLAEQLKRMKKK